MRDPAGIPDRRHHRGAPFLRALEYALLLAGAAMLGLFAYFAAESHLAQRAARQALAAAPVRGAVAAAATPALASTAPPLPAATAPERPTDTPSGAALGELTIPRVDLKAIVLHGSDAVTLRRGPGHLENTAWPGQPGNAVIAGHRDTFFRPLQHVRRGDDVFVQTPGGRFHYRVISLRVVEANDVSVLAPTRDATLTLITCYPFWVFGNAPDRFIVRAVRVSTAPIERLSDGAVPRRAADLAAPVESAAAPAPARIVDDETLVRQAIERFRLTYNARLLARPDGNRPATLAFEPCDIARLGDTATARCRPPARHPEAAGEPWLVTLERTDGAWAIRSVQSP